jgi:hypothetical protein
MMPSGFLVFNAKRKCCDLEKKYAGLKIQRL